MSLWLIEDFERTCDKISACVNELNDKLKKNEKNTDDVTVIERMENIKKILLRAEGFCKQVDKMKMTNRINVKPGKKIKSVKNRFGKKVQIGVKTDKDSDIKRNKKIIREYIKKTKLKNSEKPSNFRENLKVVERNKFGIYT